MRLDPVNFFTTLKVKLRNHIYCMLQIDVDTILCGQLHGHIDLVRISDGEILVSQNLKQQTGHIVSMIKVANRPNEVCLATKQGVFFAKIGKGRFGLQKEDVRRLEDASEFLTPDKARQMSVFAQD
jgi:hypothetical protein